MKNKPSHFNRLTHLLDHDKLIRTLKPTPNPKILAAVSGGADSVALLRSLAALASQHEITIAAIHVNHGLRPEATAEMQFVKNLCAELDIPCHLRHLSPDANTPTGGSAEAHWRALRYEIFAQVMQDRKYDTLALGHTADDLAETFLFHLARGTGVEGLTFHFESNQHGMRIIRPLWKTYRADIESALRAIGQSWVEDPSNQNTQHRRNLIRHKILPLFREINPDATSAIVRASEAISEAMSMSPAPAEPPATTPGKSSLPLSDTPPGAMPLNQFLDVRADPQITAPAILKFIRQNSAKITSRQLEQARRLITSENTGLVSLTDSKTLVITRHFAWIIPRREPSTMTLAIEHTRRFGGFVANIGHGISLNPGTTITNFDGVKYQIKTNGATQEITLSNRITGARVGNTPLKKILNQHQVPWYLREWQVYALAPDGKNVLALVSTHDTGLARTIRRHSCAKLDLQITPVANDA